MYGCSTTLHLTECKVLTKLLTVMQESNTHCVVFCSAYRHWHQWLRYAHGNPTTFCACYFQGQTNQLPAQQWCVLHVCRYSAILWTWCMYRIISSTNFNAHFNINMYVTLLSSTCFGPCHAHPQEDQLHKHHISFTTNLYPVYRSVRSQPG